LLIFFEMKKVIKSYEKLDAAMLALLQKQFPEGVNPGVILTFQDHTGKRFKGVELLDEENETVYLIKLDEMLRSTFTAEPEEKEETDEDYEREGSDPEGDSDDDNFDDSFEGIDD
jgi:hypothetical protein